MPIITFIDSKNNVFEVKGTAGTTVMEVAVSNNIPGIDADCGGACACATCHVYVQGEWLAKLQEQDDMEASMLEFAEDFQPNSRLSCQILMSDDLDGIRLTVPKTQ